MLICAAGDTHGALNQPYADVLAFEGELGVRFDHVLHVGDLGVWPDPERVDQATGKHEGAGDFPAWLAEGPEAPRSTIFVKGNHEDFAAFTWTLAYTVVMRAESLVRTNPYLRDPKRRRELLAASIRTSTAIEGVVAAAEEALAERVEAPTASRRRNAAASGRSRR